MGERTGTEGFLGRNAELAAVRAGLRAEGAAVVVVGPVGAGTTSLVREYLRASEAQLPLGGAVLCEGPIDVDALEAAVGDPAARIAADGPFLLVVTDADALDDEAEDLLLDWHRRHSDLRLLLAGSFRRTLPRSTVVELWRLDEGRDLFLARAAAHGGRLDAEDPSLDAILDALEGLPAAIEEAASRTAVLAPSQLAARLSERFSSTLPRFVGGLEQQASDLSKADREALGRLAQLDGNFGFDLAEALLGPSALDRLHSLQAACWLQREHHDDEVRFLVPRPLRSWCRERLDGEDAGSSAQAWIEHAVTEWIGGLRGPDPKKAARRLDRELHHLMRGGPEARAAAARRLIDRGDSAQALALLDGEDRVVVRLRALALAAGGRPREGLALLDRADMTPSEQTARAEILARLGRVREARDTARTAAESDGWHGAVARGLLARLQATRGRRGEALELYRQALADADAMDAAALRSELRFELGLLEAREGHLVSAQATLERARAELMAVGSERRLPRLEREVARMSALDGGSPSMEGAIELAERFGDSDELIELLRLTGSIALADGDADGAVAPWARAAELARAAGSGRMAARVACDRAWLAWSMDRQDAMEGHLAEAAGARDAGLRFEVAVLSAVASDDRSALDEAGSVVEGTTLAALPAQAYLAGALLDPSPHRIAHAWGFVPSAARRALARGRLAIVAPALALCADRLRREMPPSAWRGAWAQALDPKGEALLVQHDGSALRPSGGDWVDLSRRLQLAGLVRVLVVHHAHDRDALLDNDAVLEALWPGERMDPQSALNRVHQAASRLRKVGLGDALDRQPDGYRLHPSTKVQFLP